LIINNHPYESLTPELVIEAVESTGRLSDLRILALNSYENRVYQVGIEDELPIIAKFYRPQRWSDEQIMEEHSFAQSLLDNEIPVVPPLKNNEGETLFNYKGFRFCLYERKGGHAPELDNLDHLLVLGRLTARIHSIGAQQPFQHRPTLDLDSFGIKSAELLADKFIPKELQLSYTTLTEDLIKGIRQIFEQHPYQTIRTHGDCHSGNILWRDESPHFVDLDDSRMAPAIQDLWMFVSGDIALQTQQINELVEGYNEFYDFNPQELHLIEALRTLRIMHYSAWLARRWEDPAFPRNFPWFNTERYWANHILELREQLSLIHEPPLKLF